MSIQCKTEHSRKKHRKNKVLQTVEVAIVQHSGNPSCRNEPLSYDYKII